MNWGEVAVLILGGERPYQPEEAWALQRVLPSSESEVTLGGGSGVTGSGCWLSFGGE